MGFKVLEVGFVDWDFLGPLFFTVSSFVLFCSLSFDFVVGDLILDCCSLIAQNGSHHFSVLFH